MKKEELNICNNLYNELILHPRRSELAQAHNIVDINEDYDQIEDLARLAILDPMIMNSDDSKLFRVSRVIQNEDGTIHNYNVNLRDRGINIFCTWNYDIEEQTYFIYFYNSLLGSNSCPPTPEEIYSHILGVRYGDIRIDKENEFYELRNFLTTFRVLRKKSQKLRERMRYNERMKANYARK